MYTDNAVVHFEIPVDDIERAKKFYSETFDWKFQEFPMPANSSTGGDPYYGVITAEVDDKGMVTTPGAINGGLMKRKSPNQPFTNYINVSSIESKLEAVKANGGEICMPKTEIAPGMGWIAAFKDPEGNFLGLHELDPQHREQA